MIFIGKYSQWHGSVQAAMYALCISLLLLLGIIPQVLAEGSLLAAVCPTPQMATSNVASLYHYAICQKDQQSNCSRLDTPSLGYAYAGFIILLHSGKDWHRLGRITRRIAFCGSPSLLIDLNRREEIESAVSFCRNGAAALVLDVTGNAHFDHLTNLTDTACTTTYIPSTHPLHMFHTKCPNTLWITADHHSICNGGNQSGLLVHVNVPAQNSSPIIELSDPDDRFLLRGKVLKVATVGNGPFVRINRTNETSIHFRGIVFELLDRIAANLSFTYTVVEPLDGQYGLLQEDGSFTGLVGMLQQREIDLVAADLTVSYNRSRVIDYAPNPFFYESLGIMITEPAPSQPLWKWTSPFSYGVWLVLLAATVIVSSILYLNHIFQCVYVGWRFTHINDCLWHVGTGLLSQGLDFTPASWWGQTLLSFWWLLCLAVIAAYSGNLVAMLTTNSVTLPLSSFEDLSRLVELKQYRVCVQNGTSFYDELLNGNLDSYIPLRKFLKENPKYARPTTEECVRMMVNDDRLALVQEVNQLEDFQRIWCKNRTFIILNDRFYASLFAFGFQKGSPFVSAFSVPMLESIESGLISVWKRMYTSAAQMCQITEPNTLVKAAMKPLELTDFEGVILTFGIGIGVGLLLFLVERARKLKCFNSISRLFVNAIRPDHRTDSVKTIAMRTDQIAGVQGHVNCCAEL